jgi:hypothetical protein
MVFNKKTLRSAGIQLAAALVIAVLIAVSEGFSFSGDAFANFGYLCDGFFICGVMFTGVGALLWVSTTGFFDLFGYAVKSILSMFASRKEIDAFPGFYEYKCEQDAKRAEHPMTHTVLIVGLILLALSFAALALYYGLQP